MTTAPEPMTTEATILATSSTIETTTQLPAGSFVSLRPSATSPVITFYAGDGAYIKATAPTPTPQEV